MGWTMGLEPYSRIASILRRLPHLNRETDRDHWIIDPGRLEIGVDDGTRTHDDRDHNPGLYQLSYAHHYFRYLTKCQSNWRARQDSNLQHSA